jgi:hypothetical protein
MPHWCPDHSAGTQAGGSPPAAGLFTAKVNQNSEKVLKKIGMRTVVLSDGTVRNTLSVIRDKLQLRDRTQLAIFY